MDFNFDDLSSISRTTVRGDVAPLVKSIVKKTGKVTFRVSAALFKELGLDTNSLSAKSTKDGKKVFLAVHPGNEGDFFRSRGTKGKGNTAEHKDLADALTKAGMTGSTFRVEKTGEAKGLRYYEIQPFTVETAAKASAPKKNAAAPATV